MLKPGKKGQLPVCNVNTYGMIFCPEKGLRDLKPTGAGAMGFLKTAEFLWSFFLFVYDAGGIL